ncbi:hypothetical protein [Cardiobacterium hominis]|uniref:hypothetical protein n=1 Tax=Cardiobacterium hominis TaxID=2718 RepID=UPI000A8EAEB4|nr:hypothetical protein [Cardiobacterium hominis]
MYINSLFSASTNYINTSMQDSFLSPANIISIIAITISVAALYFNRKLLNKQNDLSKKQFTLSYIEMENNNKPLQDAKNWLYNNTWNPKKISLYANPKNYFEFHSEPIQENKESGITITQSDTSEKTLDKYITEVNYIKEIIRYMQKSSKVISKEIIDEATYKIIRHGDFQTDYYLLYPYIRNRIEYINNDVKELEARISELDSLKELDKIAEKWKLKKP